MGGSGSKWRKAAVGPPLPAEETNAGGRNRKRRGKEEEHGSGSGSQFADEREPEPGPAAAERGHWTLSLRLEGEGGSSRRSNTSTWRLPKAPCGDCTPSIRCLAGHGGAAGSPVNTRQPRAEGEPAGPRSSALTGCKLSTSHTSLPNPTHDVFMIKTRDKENNNSVNGFQIGGENVSHNLTPILYDYSEEELMASIEKEYS